MQTEPKSVRSLFLSGWGWVSVVMMGVGVAILLTAIPEFESADSDIPVPYRLPLAIVVLGAGGLLARRELREARLATRARDEGEVHIARILGFQKTDVTINEIRQYRMIWETPDGHTGRSFMRDRDYFSTLVVGDEITIYGVPEHPDRGWWMGDVGPRRKGARPAPETRAQKHDAAHRGRETKRWDNPTVRRR